MHLLGLFSEVSSRNGCSLCQFIARSFRAGPVTLADFEGRKVIQGAWEKIVNGSPNACLSIWLCPEFGVGGVRLDIRPVARDDEPVIGGGRLLNSPMIDAKLVRKWIRVCETTHSCNHTELFKLLPGFMLIDVVDMRLMATSISCRFVALSYRWGDSVTFSTTSGNIDRLRLSYGLANVWEQLSPTIQSAIAFTRSLGERYIWIDSLCILQDSAVNSNANIDIMDSIYRQALLVIIAADNTSVTEGLQGVMVPRELKQQEAFILPNLHVLGMFDHLSYMKQSVYRTRAWTFQEEQLATRSLIFINGQVYFSCSSHVYTEDIFEGDGSEPDLVLVYGNIRNKTITKEFGPIKLYFNAVQTYTTRHLTVPSDILKAFTGVGSVLGQRLGKRQLCGLPASIFDAALLWQPVGRMSRREGFPSWSWAGWKGGVSWSGDTIDLVSYRDTPEAERQLVITWLRSRTWIEWNFITADGRVEPLLGSGAQKDEHGDLIGDKIHRPMQGNQHEGAHLLEPIIAEYKSQCNPQHSSSALPGVPKNLHPLGFHTVTAHFRIQPSNAYLRYGSVDKVWEPNGRNVFLLHNIESQISGYVLLDESWTRRFSSDQAYEFLMLSEADYACQWRRPHEDHPYRVKSVLDIYRQGDSDYIEYHAMMVVWKTLVVGGVDMKVAERVGLGRVMKEALGDSVGEKAVWKEIVLV